MCRVSVTADGDVGLICRVSVIADGDVQGISLLMLMCSVPDTLVDVGLMCRVPDTANVQGVCHC